LLITGKSPSHIREGYFDRDFQSENRNVEANQPLQEATLEEVRQRMRGPNRKQPFESCIKQLQQLQNRKINLTPYEKLTAIAEISNLIKKDVQEFWQGVNV
jgi:hypothetical protein